MRASSTTGIDRDDLFIGVVLDRQPVGALAGCQVFRITKTAFFSLTSDEYDDYDYDRLIALNANISPNSNSQSNSAGGLDSPIIADLPPAAANAAIAVQNMFKLASNKTSAALKEFKDQQQQQRGDTYEDDYDPEFVASSGGRDRDRPEKHPCSSIMKLFNSGSFYYSNDYDLTSRCAVFKNRDLFDDADQTFFWNYNMLSPFLEMRTNELSSSERISLDRSAMLTIAIQGFVGVSPISNPQQSPLKLSIISRLSCRNAGTRFNARGIDDDGFVSNYVETEVLVESRSYLASFVMMRGSVPIFWEQTGIQLQHRIELGRGFEASALAFRKHFDVCLFLRIAENDPLNVTFCFPPYQTIQKRYGKIHIVNLLGGKEGGAEAILSNEYQKHFQQYVTQVGVKENVYYTSFDYHFYVKSGGHEKANLVLDHIQSHLNSWSYTLMDRAAAAAESSVLLTQQGVLRINCLDCLDRTNHVEYIAAKMMVDRILREMQLGSLLTSDAYLDATQNLWADNGDWLSKIYTGTGALKTSLTRRGKQTIMGLIDDAAKSVNRLYVNNVLDKYRTTVEHDLMARKAEFVTYEDVTIVIGTWNVNGKGFFGEPLETWLQSRSLDQPANLVLIGIQELIELNAQQIVQVGGDTEKLKTAWDSHLLRVLNDRNSGFGNGGLYVPLRSSSLLSLGLFGYVRRDCVEKVRYVELANCKTGLGGIAANKGGIGLSLQYQDSTMVFVTAHLAAGESNVEDRNRDYQTISEGLNFKRRVLKDHDFIFWFGDFNYRVSLPNTEARAFLDRGDIGPLRSHDQLSIEMARGLAFDKFTEAPIHFPPTYKYDNGTTLYDTSEKARCPSWTDRVLFKGESVRCLEYTHSEDVFDEDFYGLCPSEQSVNV
ncbi:inositol polyphosphate 5-phosphatase [Entophlyctis luteolus]|nr:inositol polyphosphate 5-phosphatase [Entophlyctis luteolus]